MTPTHYFLQSIENDEDVLSIAAEGMAEYIKQIDNEL
jgi:hypothetical protein